MKLLSRGRRHRRGRGPAYPPSRGKARCQRRRRRPPRPTSGERAIDHRDRARVIKAATDTVAAVAAVAPDIAAAGSNVSAVATIATGGGIGGERAIVKGTVNFE